MRRVRRLPGRLGALAGVLAVVAAAGCNIVAPIAYFVEGPPTKDAEYVLPKERTAVVFVDDPRTIVRMNSRAIVQTVADRTTQEMLDRELVVRAILPRDALAVARAQDRAGGLLAMDEIARTVEAEVLVYLEMVTFTEFPDGVTPRPTASCSVRVIDAVERTRLFPPADSPEPARFVTATLGTLDPQVFQSPASRRQVHDTLAKALGDEVVKLFYKHEIRELGGNLQ